MRAVYRNSYKKVNPCRVRSGFGAGCLIGRACGTRVPMKDQVHIRNAEAAHLARALARQTGKTMNEVVLDALRQYRPGGRTIAGKGRMARWQKLLRRDRAALRASEVPIEALYDEETGLPA